MADMVARTLEAFALEAAKTLQPEWGFDAPGEQHSVEVTQAPTPQKTEEPGAASDNLQTNELPEYHYIWNILGTGNFSRSAAKLQRRMTGRSILVWR